MAYSQKTWTDRTSEYPNRYRMTSSNGNIADVSIVPNEGNVTAQGEKFSAETMNDMEGRIANGFNDAHVELLAKETSLKAYTDEETTRASTAEGGLATEINLLSQQVNGDLQDEITRATGVEGGLDTRLTTAEGEIDTLQSQMTTVTQTADSALSIAQDAQANLVVETNRAQQVETLLQGKIDDNTSAINGEITRATGVEGTLNTRVTALETKITAAYKPGGTIYFAQLPPLTEMYLGYVYNIKNDFTTTADFIEGAGISYPAGTNIAIIEIPEVVYHEVTPVGDENPSEEGWYEEQTIGTSEVFVLTEDTTVVTGKEYYTMTTSTIYYDVMVGGVGEGFYLEQDDIVLSTSDVTTVTFTDARITSSSLIDGYCNIDGIEYATMSTTDGSCVLTFSEQDTAVTINVRLWVR